MEKANKKKSLNPYILVIISFIGVILIGSLLLTMPWANHWHKWLFYFEVPAEEGYNTQIITYLDCLFTAVSATCVTGLNTYANPVAATLTVGGQIVLASMIQIGGLGFITILTFLITLFRSKLEFKNRYFIAQMVNSTNFADVVKFVRKLILISLLCEVSGTLLGLPVFFTLYPNSPLLAIWNSAFFAISAFNNAGFDLFKNSMEGGVATIAGTTLSQGLYVYLCIYTMLLIVFGGISFMVILEVFGSKKKPNQWRPFTKIVLCTTASLLLFGFFFFLLAECFKGTNSMTVLDAAFQSVTCRTAGFYTYNQDNLSVGSKVVSCLLMFIGGSPISTAGGIKTTTIYMIILAMVSYFSGKRPTSFKRSYSANMVVRAMSLLFMVLIIVVVGYVAVSIFGLDSKYNYESLGLNSSFSMAAAYVVFSAMGTVGLPTGMEAYLSVGSKLVLCLVMFLGRIGPITVLQIFQANMDKENKLHYEYVEEDFLIG